MRSWKKGKKGFAVFMAFLFVFQHLLIVGMFNVGNTTHALDQDGVTSNVYGPMTPLGFSVTSATYDTAHVSLTGMKLFYFDADDPVDYESPEAKNRLNVGENVILRLDWELPNAHLYNDGATYEFELPLAIKLHNDIGFDAEVLLTSSDNQRVGTFTVTKDDNLVTMKFDKTHLPFLKGTLEVWSTLSEDIVSTTSEIEIHFPVFGIGIPVKLQPKGGSSILKTGEPNAAYNGTEITWTVDVNTSLEEISDAVITDDISAMTMNGETLPDNGMLLSAVEVYELDVDLNGHVTGEHIMMTGFTNKSTGNWLEIELGDIDSAYRVKYITTITNTDWEGGRTFKNEAILSGDAMSDMKASATVTISRGKTLEKSVKGVDYESPPPAITWEIKYNYNLRNIDAADALLIDTFDPSSGELKLDTASFVVYKVELKNGVEEDSSVVDPANYTLTPILSGDGHSGFELQFNDAINDAINDAYRIQYETQVISKVFDEMTIENKVTTDSGEKLDSVTQSITQGVLRKTRGQVNYHAKTVDWKITFNRDEYDMEEIVITDTYPNGGLRLIESSVDVSGVPIDKYSVDLILDNGEEKGFTITFESDVVIDKHTTVTYTTNFDPNLASKLYRNQVRIDWKENSNDYSKTGVSSSFDPNEYTKKDGFKRGSYDIDTKIITWDIGLNYNLNDIGQAVLTDEILSNQILEGLDSVNVYKMLIPNAKTSPDGGTPQKGTLVDASEYDVLISENAAGNQVVTITFDHITDQDAYWVTIETSLVGVLTEDVYENIAVLNDGVKDIRWDAEVEVPYGTQYVIKKGEQDGLFMDWTVWINPGQSYVPAGAVVIDTPTNNQFLLEDTFKIYYNTEFDNGKVEKGSHPLELDASKYEIEFKENEHGDDTFQITFFDAFEEPYLLEYRSYINAKHGQVVNNTVEFKGSGIATAHMTDHFPYTVRLSGGAGTGAGEVGKITITKVDTDNHSVLLDGANFSLYFKSNGKLVRSGTTGDDGNGILVFDHLMFTDYVLVENDAPAGYVLINGLSNKHHITLTPADNHQELTIENFKEGSRVNLGNYVWVDVNRNGIQDEDPEYGVDGVTVKLYQRIGGNFVEVDERTTAKNSKDEPGYYLFEGLKADESYQVCFHLPDGYAFTDAEEGTDTELDSDAMAGTKPAGAHPSAECSDVVILQNSKDDLSIDAGLLLGQIGNYVWLDDERNGIQDESAKEGVNGVLVELYKQIGGTYTKIGEQMTKNNEDGDPGYYLFDELYDGKYLVCFHLPDGYGFTDPLEGTDREVDSDARLDSSIRPDGASVKTGCSDEIDLPAGGQDLTIDAGLIKLGRIGDYVWYDANEDGVQDDESVRERGINNVTVKLYKKNKLGDFVEIDETETDDNDHGDPGYYLFDELEEGTYQVCFFAPIGYAFTAAHEGHDDTIDSDADVSADLAKRLNSSTQFVGCSDEIELPAGGENLTIDAGLILGRLGNYVWLDADRNGIQDERVDRGVNGVTVKLFQQNIAGNFVEVAEMMTEDDVNGEPGYYLFDELKAGTYQVCFFAPVGYAFTAAHEGHDDALDSNANVSADLAKQLTSSTQWVGCSDEIELPAGGENLTIDAGLLLGRLGDYVWVDNNRNGIQDEEADLGVNDVTVTLYKENKKGELEEVATAMTKDSDDGEPGYYLFDELTAGIYQVCFELPRRHYFSKKSQGSDRTLDSDANQRTGCSERIVLLAGDENLTIDAGIYRSSNSGGGILLPSQPGQPDQPGDDPEDMDEREEFERRGGDTPKPKEESDEPLSEEQTSEEHFTETEDHDSFQEDAREQERLPAVDEEQGQAGEQSSQPSDREHTDQQGQGIEASEGHGDEVAGAGVSPISTPFIGTLPQTGAESLISLWLGLALCTLVAGSWLMRKYVVFKRKE